MRAFQLLDRGKSNPLYKVDPVFHDVSAFVVITRGALLVYVGLIKSKLRSSPNTPIVAGVILAAMVSPATDTLVNPIPSSDVCVKCLLSVFGPL
jgi:hypothetical protein